MTLGRIWLEKAIDCHILAQAALNLCLWDLACFNCHQAAEIALKAVLILHRGRWPRIHDIEELLAQCRRYDSEFERFANRAGFISQMYLAARYSNVAGAQTAHSQRYSEADANAALAYTGEILALAQAQFPDEMPDSET